MQKLPEIRASYDWFYDTFDTEVRELSARNDVPAIERMEAKRDIFERGIFVLMFGQFEKAVVGAFERARDTRTGNPDWTQRRGWDTSALASKRVPFETKLAMVLDSRSSSFGQIINTYGIRNHCAHGGTTSPVGSIDALEADLYRWHSELRS